MTTECTQKAFEFHALYRREVIAQFNGGTLTSDGGALLLRETEKRLRIIDRFAQCFTDYRKPEWIEHTVYSLVSQRIYGLALGYEDLNDHEQLRRDPLMAVLAEREDVEGEDRRQPQDKGKPLAGKSTLNRLELTGEQVGEQERYKKILLDMGAVDKALVDYFLDSYRRPPRQVVLDLDTTDDRLHGNQEGRFFHGYYGDYCYLPLYILRSSPAVRPAATFQYRWLGGKRGRAGADRSADPGALAEGAGSDPRRFRFLPGSDHGLV